MLIAIDGIAITSSQAGGYRTYTCNLVKALQEVDSRHTFRLVVDRPYASSQKQNWGVDVVRRRGSLGFIWREQVTLPRVLARGGVDLLHAPAATGPVRCATPSVVTIHDTIEFGEPLPSPFEARRWAMRVYSRSVQANAALKAAHILTVSAYSKGKIVERFGIPPERITVTHLAAPAQFQPGNRAGAGSMVLRRYGAADYVMGIASLAPRKNTDMLLSAYARLTTEVKLAHPLLLVCTHAGVRKQLTEKVRGMGIEAETVIVDSISDSELAWLYRAAAVFVFPSLEEGFGLPPLEAMASGAPVIAGNSSAVPEVVGDAAILVSPRDSAALTEAMGAVLSSPALAKDLAARGLERKEAFSWKRTAEKTMAAYELALGL